ncbi:MAG: RNA polymerase sigma factor [Pirellulaceae bacterium]
MNQLDTHQLRQLLGAHGAALVLFARQWCQAPDDALQEALIDLLRQAPVPDCPVAWLFKTVRRKAMNLARAERRRAKYHRQAAQEREPWFLHDASTGFEPGELEPMLGELPQLEREIVVARIWGELSFEQIAELVERSTSAVHRRYERALALLGSMINGRRDRSR